MFGVCVGTAGVREDAEAASTDLPGATLLDSLCDALEALAHPGRDEEERAAAAAALAASGLPARLTEGGCAASSRKLHAASARSWATAIALLQDEDDGVREAAAAAVVGAGVWVGDRAPATLPDSTALLAPALAWLARHGGDVATTRATLLRWIFE